MRFGCCLNMIATGADGTGIEWIEKLANAGYDYVELPLAQMMALSDAEFAALSERVKKSGIACEVCNNFFPADLRLTGSDAALPPVLDYAKRALSRAEALGVSYVVFGSGPAKNVPEGFPIEAGYRQVVELLKAIDPIAGKHEITIVIEPLRRAECNLINTFEEGCRLAEDVNGPNVKVLVDFYHLSVEKEPVSHLLEKGRAYLRHVHFANPEGRVYPESADEADYDPFFRALHEIGYDSRISCEAYTQDFDKAAGKTLHFFKICAAKAGGF